LNIFVLSLPVKNFVFSLLLVLYGAFMFSYMRENLSMLVDGPQKLQLYAPKRP
jgi:type III secretory pathway component EscT